MKTNSNKCMQIKMVKRIKIKGNTCFSKESDTRTKIKVKIKTITPVSTNGGKRIKIKYKQTTNIFVSKEGVKRMAIKAKINKKCHKHVTNAPKGIGLA